MLQVLRKGLKEIVLEEVPEPTSAQGEVKIASAYTIISSGTEIAGLHREGLVRAAFRDRHRLTRLIRRAVTEQGPFKTAEAMLDKLSELSITGYSGSGYIIERSPDVLDLRTGERVAFGGINTGHAEIVCASRNLVAAVPDEVGLKEASLTTLGSIALHAVRNAQITIGDAVAVVGAGLIGQIVIQLARISGARVFGIDIDPARLKQAASLGAELALDASSAGGLGNAVLRRTGGKGADAVIVCASSRTSRPLETAMDIARSRARIVVVGMIRMEMSWEKAFRKELKVLVSRAYGPGSYDAEYEKRGIDYPIDYVRWTENRNMNEFLRLLKERRIDTERIISHEFPFRDAPEAFRMISAGDSRIVGAVLRHPERVGAGEEKNPESVPVPAGKAKTNRSRLKVGVIGIGNIARWVHLPNVKRHPDLELSAVCTNKGYRARYFGDRYHSRYCATDYRRILDDREIDMVIVCTRHDSHARIAGEALQSGKHVFLEKPMAMTVEDCRMLVRAARDSGLGLQVNFNRRFSPLHCMAREAVSGKEPKLISIRMNSPDMTESYWMTDEKEGGGAVLGEGCHFFDLMAWYAGSEPVSIFARSVREPDSPVISRSNIACTVSFENGSVGSLVYQTIGGRGLGPERTEISACGCTVVVDDFRRICVWNGISHAPHRKWKFRSEKGHYENLDSFIKKIRSGAGFDEEAAAGARATICALSALESVRTELPVRIGGNG
ncbi:MAG: bi-domain-containing oxidoreductase [Syntrophales bacterium]|nr:bi-domain-containing oxidoreductase [Syntrophales bacterium]